MTIKQINKDLQIKYLNMLHQLGENGLFRRAVGTGLIESENINDPDLEILNLADAFFALHRRTGDENYFTIAKVLRRAAHVIYRELMRQNKDKKPNFQRFLNVI